MGGRGEVIREGQQDSEVINLRHYLRMEIDNLENPRWRPGPADRENVGLVKRILRAKLMRIMKRKMQLSNDDVRGCHVFCSLEMRV